MTQHRATIRLDLGLGPGSTPPAEFRLFRFGPNKTTKGVFTLTPEGAQLCLAAAAEYGNELAIDYGHAMLDDAAPRPDEAGKAAGWFRLGLRDDGLWAVDVTWTPRAAEMLSSREYRYTSPAFFTNKAGEVVAIINCAITNVPATHNLTPLVASQSGADASHEATSMSDSAVAEAAPETAAVEASHADEAVELSNSAYVNKLKADNARLTVERDEARGERDEVLSRVGAKSAPEALGIVEALKADAAAGRDAVAKLVKLEADQRAAQLRGLLDQGERDGKLTPASRAKLAEKAEALGAEFLAAYLAAKGRELPASGDVPDAPAAAIKPWAELSNMERHRLYREQPELYKQLKAAAQAGRLSSYSERVLRTWLLARSPTFSSPNCSPRPSRRGSRASPRSRARAPRSSTRRCRTGMSTSARPSRFRTSPTSASSTTSPTTTTR